MHAQLEVIAGLLVGGYLELYDGTQPKTPDMATSEPPLARLAFGSPAFDQPEKGMLEAHPLEPETSAPGGGMARWFRCYTADDQAVLDGTVGTQGTDLVLDETTILRGMRVLVDGFSITQEE